MRIIRNNLMFDRDSRNAYLSVLVRNVEWSINSAWMAGAVGFDYPGH
ncbi:MAG: hypothetical protein MUD12_17155 [Spirochaetes bacterium]|nr:hypothetical protein [Spirochaetota bacterium]